MRLIVGYVFKLNYSAILSRIIVFPCVCYFVVGSCVLATLQAIQVGTLLVAGRATQAVQVAS